MSSSTWRAPPRSATPTRRSGPASCGRAGSRPPGCSPRRSPPPSAARLPRRQRHLLLRRPPRPGRPRARRDRGQPRRRAPHPGHPGVAGRDRAGRRGRRPGLRAAHLPGDGPAQRTAQAAAAAVPRRPRRPARRRPAAHGDDLAARLGRRRRPPGRARRRVGAVQPLLPGDADQRRVHQGPGQPAAPAELRDRPRGSRSSSAPGRWPPSCSAPSTSSPRPSWRPASSSATATWSPSYARARSVRWLSLERCERPTARPTSQRPSSRRRTTVRVVAASTGSGRRTPGPTATPPTSRSVTRSVQVDRERLSSWTASSWVWSPRTTSPRVVQARSIAGRAAPPPSPACRAPTAASGHRAPRRATRCASHARSTSTGGGAGARCPARGLDRLGPRCWQVPRATRRAAGGEHGNQHRHRERLPRHDDRSTRRRRRPAELIHRQTGAHADPRAVLLGGAGSPPRGGRRRCRHRAGRAPRSRLRCRSTWASTARTGSSPTSSRAPSSRSRSPRRPAAASRPGWSPDPPPGVGDGPLPLVVALHWLGADHDHAHRCPSSGWTATSRRTSPTAGRRSRSPRRTAVAATGIRTTARTRAPW